MNFQSMKVQLQLQPIAPKDVGTVTINRGETLFQFDNSFLLDPLPLSPFRLPTTPGIHAYDRKGDMETFGMLEDSLPDGWGRKMIDRHFRKLYNRTPTVLERLACVGTDGMGALCYYPEYEFEGDPQAFDLAELAKNAWDFDDDKVEYVLPELRMAAGSSGGARPKVLVALSDSTDEIIPSSLKLPSGFSHWIIKFNTRDEGPTSGPLEFAYNEVARKAGADVPPCRLIETTIGRFFATKRFDRHPDGRRLHMHSASGLLHSNFRVPGEEYETLFKLCDALTRNYQDKIELFRRTTLNVLAHNRDDHLKNFTFLMNETGKWSLSPLYDFTYNQGPNGWHTLSVAGEGQNPSIPDLLRLSESVGLHAKDTNEILEQVQDALSELPRLKKGLKI